jgi:hypothetical protein
MVQPSAPVGKMIVPTKLGTRMALSVISGRFRKIRVFLSGKWGRGCVSEKNNDSDCVQFSPNAAIYNCKKPENWLPMNN